MVEIASWSVSAHRAYRACPRQWWLISVARVDRDVDSENARGIVLHAGLAAGYIEVARCQQEGQPDEEILRRVDAAVDEAVCLAARDLGYVRVDEASDVCSRTLRHLGPRWGDEVLGVEHRMDIVVDDVPLTYRADVVYRRGGVLVVRDWKSSSELPHLRDVKRNRQLMLGALCAARIFDARTVRVEIASINAAVAVGAMVDPTAARQAGEVVADSARDAAVDAVFTPTPGAACSRCPVRRYCPVYADDEADVVEP